MPGGCLGGTHNIHNHTQLYQTPYKKNKSKCKKFKSFAYICGMEEQKTLGERRCHISFNPSFDDKISTFKRMCADAIDFCNNELVDSSDPEAKRCFSIAMTELETAQMYGVKGIAKGL